MTWTTFAAAVSLAAVHVVSQLLRVLREIPRSRLLSLASGISVAFAVLRILPSLRVAQEQIERTGTARLFPFLRDHMYVLVLASIVVLHGLERLARRSRRARQREGTDVAAAPGIFWLHLATFTLVNLFVGYALVGVAARGEEALGLFALAMFVKFIVNDHGLHADYRDMYDRVGRWVLAAAVLGGWLVGTLTLVPEGVLLLTQAVIAGVILHTALKEELPAERESSFTAFAVGAAAYGALLLAL